MIRLILFSALLLLCFTLEAFSQCESEQYTQTLVEKIPQGYSFLKSFPIQKQNPTQAKVELPYIFSKDSSYLISFLGQQNQTSGIILTLFDANRNLVASSKDPESAKNLSGINYTCGATGVYYLTFSFENQTAYCAGAVIGFKR